MEKGFSFEQRSSPETQKEKEKISLLRSLQEIEGATVSENTRESYSYKLRFENEKSFTSVYILFYDEENGADISITSITTLPKQTKDKVEEVRGMGGGSRAVQKIIEWGRANGFTKIMAAQVQESAKDFWTKNGFVYDEREDNYSEEWIYRG